MADLPSTVEPGLQKIYGFQHNDGGQGWWYNDSGNEYQTVDVLFGLAATKDAGASERGMIWLDSQLDGMDARTAAYGFLT